MSKKILLAVAVAAVFGAAALLPTSASAWHRHWGWGGWGWGWGPAYYAYGPYYGYYRPYYYRAYYADYPVCFRRWPWGRVRCYY